LLPVVGTLNNNSMWPALLPIWAFLAQCRRRTDSPSCRNVGAGNV